MHHKKSGGHSLKNVDHAVIDTAMDTSPLDSGVKYSLRQRQKRQSTRNKSENEIDGDTAAMGPISSEEPAQVSPSHTAKSKKAKDKVKAKPKAAPLSKYRRKTANARERTRMREINSAFETLRNCVPLSISDGTPSNSNEKLTKITTLRLAMKYINTLNELLTSPSEHRDTNILLNSIMNRSSISDASNINNNNNNSLTVNNNERSSASDVAKANSGIVAVEKTKGKSKTVATTNKSNNTKRRTNKTNSTKTSRSRTAAKKNETYLTQNPINNVCLTPPPSIDSSIDLGLMLESDGESLHLSEPCLSPISSGQQVKPFDCAPSINNHALDIGMFLESDNDSLQFSEPCLSPLGGFDALSPFGDLLHSTSTLR